MLKFYIGDVLQSGFEQLHPLLLSLGIFLSANDVNVMGNVGSCVILSFSLASALEP